MDEASSFKIWAYTFFKASSFTGNMKSLHFGGGESFDLSREADFGGPLLNKGPQGHHQGQILKHFLLSFKQCSRIKLQPLTFVLS